MTIIEFLKQENAKISYGDKWLFYEDYFEEYVVMQRKYRTKENKILIRTNNEEKAIAVLKEK